jgi:hypothetical protein
LVKCNHRYLPYPPFQPLKLQEQLELSLYHPLPIQTKKRVHLERCTPVP